MRIFREVFQAVRAFLVIALLWYLFIQLPANIAPDGSVSNGGAIAWAFAAIVYGVLWAIADKVIKVVGETVGIYDD